MSDVKLPVVRFMLQEFDETAMRLLGLSDVISWVSRVVPYDFMRR